MNENKLPKQFEVIEDNQLMMFHSNNSNYE